MVEKKVTSHVLDQKQPSCCISHIRWKGAGPLPSSSVRGNMAALSFGMFQGFNVKDKRLCLRIEVVSVAEKIVG